jgi:hypothetical protein
MRTGEPDTYVICAHVYAYNGNTCPHPSATVQEEAEVLSFVNVAGAGAQARVGGALAASSGLGGSIWPGWTPEGPVGGLRAAGP